MVLETTLLRSKEYPANENNTRRAIAGCFLFAAPNCHNLETRLYAKVIEGQGPKSIKKHQKNLTSRGASDKIIEIPGEGG
jgi:hypothetical protein